MDFTKFVCMLENEGLFFSRLDCLDDPFEGSRSHADELLRAEQYSPTVRAASAAFTQSSTLKRVMVNCWHMSEHESAAMWRLYAKRNEAISVQATYESLRQCLDQEVKIGQIRYIDYELEHMDNTHPFYSPTLHKRKSFEHEKEIRALIYNSDTDPASIGVWKKVNLGKLIDKIYVAPTSSTWFRKLVEKLAIRYTLNKPVVQSCLNHDPIF
jgi:hypothetical protein